MVERQYRRIQRNIFVLEFLKDRKKFILQDINSKLKQKNYILINESELSKMGVIFEVKDCYFYDKLKKKNRYYKEIVNKTTNISLNDNIRNLKEILRKEDKRRKDIENGNMIEMKSVIEFCFLLHRNKIDHLSFCDKFFGMVVKIPSLNAVAVRSANIKKINLTLYENGKGCDYFVTPENGIKLLRSYNENEKQRNF